MADMAVANAILEQLGGARFVAMTGAKLIVGGESHLQFKLPARFAKDGINCVRVELEPSDTYRAIFYKLGRTSTVIVHRVDGVHADSLRAVFTSATGLETSLGSMAAV